MWSTLPPPFTRLRKAQSLICTRRRTRVYTDLWHHSGRRILPTKSRCGRGGQNIVPVFSGRAFLTALDTRLGPFVG